MFRRQIKREIREDHRGAGRRLECRQPTRFMVGPQKNSRRRQSRYARERNARRLSVASRVCSMARAPTPQEEDRRLLPAMPEIDHSRSRRRTRRISWRADCHHSGSLSPSRQGDHPSDARSRQTRRCALPSQLNSSGAPQARDCEGDQKPGRKQRDAAWLWNIDVDEPD